jgi:hypothetical protein
MKRVRRMYHRRIMTSRRRNDEVARDGVGTYKFMAFRSCIYYRTMLRLFSLNMHLVFWVVT